MLALDSAGLSRTVGKKAKRLKAVPATRPECSLLADYSSRERERPRFQDTDPLDASIQRRPTLSNCKTASCATLDRQSFDCNQFPLAPPGADYRAPGQGPVSPVRLDLVFINRRLSPLKGGLFGLCTGQIAADCVDGRLSYYTNAAI